MTVKITDRSGESLSRYREAARKGIAAGATVITNAVKDAHDSSYYKGGAFRDTVKVRQSIRQTKPVMGTSGWEVRIGTNKIVALYWELGHHNTFTRRYERRALWVPAAVASSTAARAAFARVVARVMNAA